MQHDKKRQDGQTMFILVHGIGRASVCKNVDLAAVARFLDRAA